MLGPQPPSSMGPKGGHSEALRRSHAPWTPMGPKLHGMWGSFPNIFISFYSLQIHSNAHGADWQWGGWQGGWRVNRNSAVIQEGLLILDAHSTGCLIHNAYYCTNRELHGDCCFVFDFAKMRLFSRDRNSPVKLLRQHKNTEFGFSLYFQAPIKLESFDLSSWEPSMPRKKVKKYCIRLRTKAGDSQRRFRGAEVCECSQVWVL